MIAKRKPRLLYFLAIIVVGGSIALAYELGQYSGGYSYFDQRRERDVLTATIEERDRTIENLQRRVAILETSQEVDRETYSQVEDNLGELQARIQEQEEELAFYRGIISPEDGVAGLRVQTLQVRSTDSERSYVLHLVLVQAITHDRRVSGSVRLDFVGLLDGEPARLGLADLVADDAGPDLAYSFRYFQDLQRQLVFPAGFQPEEVLLQVKSREPSGQALEQTFEWSSISG